MLYSQPAVHKTAPVIGKSVRYCNPLPIETASKDGTPQGLNLGDVTVVREGDLYYLFATGGGAWVSKDFVDWKYQPAEVRGGRLPVAPHVVKYNGAFYMSGNDAPLYKAPTILGPYEVLGPWKDEKGEPWGGVSNGKTWKGAFDVDLFVDDDNKPYLYFPGRSTDGIYVAPLDPKDLTRFAAAPRHLFGFDPKHTWEHWGENNEYRNIAWIEGPWVFKRNGTYYVEYSASGTQWMSYASGIYSSKSPLGPFVYSPRNPFLRKTSGIVTGPGHGSIVKGPDGNWWVFYTIVLANPPGGRRIGMEPVGFDAQGNPYVREVTETPQWAPGVVANPVRDGDSGFDSTDSQQNARHEPAGQFLEPAAGTRCGLRSGRHQRRLVGAGPKATRSRRSRWISPPSRSGKIRSISPWIRVGSSSLRAVVDRAVRRLRRPPEVRHSGTGSKCRAMERTSRPCSTRPATASHATPNSTNCDRRRAGTYGSPSLTGRTLPACRWVSWNSPFSGISGLVFRKCL